MIYSIFFIGCIATIIGAAPPGASNLAVIKTTLQENIQESLKISYGAGIGEVLLALIAFSFGMMVQDFITMNLWIQVAGFVILGVVGIYLIRKKKTEKNPSKIGSKYVTGFLLSLINPPVLVYWILVFSFVQVTLNFHLDMNNVLLILFIAGVFTGKVLTLYAYSKLGTHLATKKDNFKSNINVFIGSVLLGLSIIQGLRLLFF